MNGLPDCDTLSELRKLSQAGWQGITGEMCGCAFRRGRPLPPKPPPRAPAHHKSCPTRPSPSRTAAAARQLSYHPSCRLNCPVVHHYFHTSLWSGVCEQGRSAHPLHATPSPSTSRIQSHARWPRSTGPHPVPTRLRPPAAPLPIVIVAAQRLIPSRLRRGRLVEAAPMPPLSQPEMPHRIETPLSRQSPKSANPGSVRQRSPKI